jgi:hypothetical protein
MAKSPKTQIQKFKEASRETDANESQEDFDVKLKAIAKAKPAKASKQK